MNPKYLIRKSDGKILTRDSEGYYSFEDSDIRYSYNFLMNSSLKGEFEHYEESTNIYSSNTLVHTPM